MAGPWRVNTDRLRRAVRAEKRVASVLAGRRTAASGSQPGDKGDVRVETKGERWLVEVKQSVSPRYSLTLKTWNTIANYAVKKGKEPLLVLEIAGQKLAVMDLNAFQALTALDERDIGI